MTGLFAGDKISVKSRITQSRSCILFTEITEHSDEELVETSSALELQKYIGKLL